MAVGAESDLSDFKLNPLQKAAGASSVPALGLGGVGQADALHWATSLVHNLRSNFIVRVRQPIDAKLLGKLQDAARVLGIGRQIGHDLGGP